MIVDLTVPTSVPLEQIGGKAYNLHKLTNLGLPVPPAIVITADVSQSRSSVNKQALHTSLMTHPAVVSGKKFAVRSSGVGEDGDNNSCAGIFESYLDVEPDQLTEAIDKVWSSLQSRRSKMYADERGITIEKMGVVVQHMINATYAGVAFSTCPVERDDRIALIEVVAGNGDSLVSGQKTPATMRVNKVTAMMRITRNGIDNIASEQLESIYELLMPTIIKIEQSYGIPVDIEWAIADDKLYILQARPITT